MVVKIKKFLQVVGFAPVFLLSQPTYAAALNIHPAPLFLGGAIEPNIMLILDDSGSMHWENLPEDNWTYFVYPRASNIYSTSDYGNFVVAFDDSLSYSVRVRSNHSNDLYYNPEITYTPWVSSTGAPYLTSSPNADSSGNASITCAPHNPAKTSVGCRNLTVNNTESASWESYNGLASGFPAGVSTTTESRTFWPAVYYRYTGTIGDETQEWTASNYSKVEIKSSVSTYTDGDRSGRTDCASAPTCSYAEEIQNFANWYSYYRSRILLARNGIGKAFASQSSGIRVGFAAFNKGSDTIDGYSSSGGLVSGVRPFSGTDRTDFFDTLYGYAIGTGNTPTRRALDDVGQYFEWADDRGPWSATPGVDADTSNAEAQYECRLSFSVLMTDGYWNSSAAGTSGANANVDNASGPTINDPDANSYQYTPVNPYSDGHTGTLADVAMYYWNRDLRSDLANEVPTSAVDEAFWQHMVTYTVGLGVTGTLDPASDLAGLTAGTTLWPQPSSGGTGANIDDLWHAALNSRGEYFSASDPEQFATTLEATLASIGQRVSSAAAIATNSTRLNDSTFVYQARFDSTDWSGQFLAYAVDQNTGDVATTASWDSSAAMPAHSARTVLTYDPTANSGAGGGADFLWASLNATQKSQLNNGGSDTDGQNRLGWLRGDPNNEQRNGGTLRNRNNGVLGDIVNSDPWRVSQDNFGYHILPGTEGSSYLTYRASTAYQERSKVIYVGANDGMLHAFDAGTWDASLDLDDDGTAEGGFAAGTGVEKFAYVPNALLPDLHLLTDPNYTHRYFVDGPSRASDAYINGAWKTVLVGTLGAGGQGVFALDVSNPDSMDASKVLWELTDATDLGYTMGQPTVARMYNGHWAAIFGNGYNSASGKAILFIKDLEDGTVYKLDTEAGDSVNKNGLSTPTAIDINNDGIVDAIYAGDLFGNLWKFDVTAANENQWDVAFKQGSTPEPLFTATDATSNPQPITAKVDVGTHPNGGVMVYFGTGKYIEVYDTGSTDIQTLYGIWDDGVAVAGRGALAEQQILLEKTETFEDSEGNPSSSSVRVTSSNPVNYTSEGDNPDRKGWFMDLLTPDIESVSVDDEGNLSATNWAAIGERVVSAPILHDGRVLFTTMIPEENPCDFGGTSWSMDLTAFDGSRPSVSSFDLNNDNYFDADDYFDAQEYLVSETGGDVGDGSGGDGSGGDGGGGDGGGGDGSGGDGSGGDGSGGDGSGGDGSGGDGSGGDGSGGGTDILNLLKYIVSGKQSTVGITKTPAVIKVGDREYRYAGGSEGGIEKTTGARSTKTGRQSWWQIR